MKLLTRSLTMTVISFLGNIFEINYFFQLFQKHQSTYSGWHRFFEVGGDQVSPSDVFSGKSRTMLIKVSMLDTWNIENAMPFILLNRLCTPRTETFRSMSMLRSLTLTWGHRARAITSISPSGAMNLKYQKSCPDLMQVW